MATPTRRPGQYAKARFRIDGQLLGLPLAAGMEKILRAPTAVLAAVGPDDAGEAATAKADQGPEGLAHAALKGALLGKDGAPVLADDEKLDQQAHRTSGRSEKVFFSGRRKRSPRATFFGERGDRAFAVDGDAEVGLDAVQDLGDVQGRAGLLEYVEGHVQLRQTFAAVRRGSGWRTSAETADGAELGV
jgi:hypothetical protein